MDIASIGNALGSLVGGTASGVAGPLMGGVLGLGKWFLEAREQRKLREIEEKAKADEHSRNMELADKEMDRVRLKGQLELEKEVTSLDLQGMAATAAAQDREISALGAVLERAYTFVNSFLVVPVFTVIVAVQKLIRPGITIYLMILTTDLFHKITAKIGGVEALGLDTLEGMLLRIVNTVLVLTEVAVTFWFVTRPNNLRK